MNSNKHKLLKTIVEQIEYDEVKKKKKKISDVLKNRYHPTRVLLNHFKIYIDFSSLQSVRESYCLFFLFFLINKLNFSSREVNEKKNLPYNLMLFASTSAVKFAVSGWAIFERTLIIQNAHRNRCFVDAVSQ